MDNNLAIGLSVIAAPSLFGVAIYFFNDYKNGTDDRITRLEGLAMSASKTSKENQNTISKIQHEIEIVIKEDTRSLVVLELHKMKKELDLLLEKDRMEMSDIKNHDYFIKRHEEALGKVHIMLKSHYAKIQDMYLRINNLGLK